MKQICRILLILILVMCLGACQTGTEVFNNGFYNYLTDCQIVKDELASGVKYAKSESGYYVHLSKYLFYVDAATMETTPLCAKPNCLHNDEGCNSYVGRTQGIAYNNGKVYTVVEAGPEYGLEGSCFNCVSADGAEHKTFAHIKETVYDWMVHRGYIYYSIKKGIDVEAITLENYGEVQAAILRFSLDSPDKQELVYSSAEGLEDAFLYKLRAFGDYMYFMEQWLTLNDLNLEWKRVSLSDLSVSDIKTPEGVALGIPYLLGDKLLMRGEKLGDGSYQYYLCDENGENAKKFFATTNHEKVYTDGTYIYFDDINNLLDSENITENSQRKMTVYDKNFHKVDDFYIVNKDVLGSSFYSADDSTFVFARKTESDDYMIFYYDKSEFGSLKGGEWKCKFAYNEAENSVDNINSPGALSDSAPHGSDTLVDLWQKAKDKEYGVKDSFQADGAEAEGGFSVRIMWEQDGGTFTAYFPFMEFQNEDKAKEYINTNPYALQKGNIVVNIGVESVPQEVYDMLSSILDGTPIEPIDQKDFSGENFVFE